MRLEAGATANASCRVVGAFPAEDAHFSLVLDGRSLDVAVTEGGDTLTASTRLSPRTAGLQELNCTVTVGAAARTARAQLHVYRKPSGEAFFGRGGCPLNPIPNIELSVSIPQDSQRPSWSSARCRRVAR